MEEKSLQKQKADQSIFEANNTFLEYAKNNKIKEWVDIYLYFLDEDVRNIICTEHLKNYNDNK